MIKVSLEEYKEEEKKNEKKKLLFFKKNIIKGYISSFKDTFNKAVFNLFYHCQFFWI